ncbi:MAG: hypothetical protein IJP35_00900 [Clostridia bacterium]|nr:hypothetical protein [Clostridia bacterium]
MKKMIRLVLIFLLIFATVGCSAGGILTQPRDPSYDTDSTVSWEDALLTSSSDTDSEDDDYDSDDAYTDYYSSSGNKYYTKEEFVRECRSVLENDLETEFLTIQNVKYEDWGVTFDIVAETNNTTVVFAGVIGSILKEDQPNGRITGVICTMTTEALKVVNNMEPSEGLGASWVILAPVAYAFMKPHAGYDISWESFIEKIYIESRSTTKNIHRVNIGNEICRFGFGQKVFMMGCGSMSDNIDGLVF